MAPTGGCLGEGGIRNGALSHNRGWHTFSMAISRPGTTDGDRRYNTAMARPPGGISGRRCMEASCGKLDGVESPFVALRRTSAAISPWPLSARTSSAPSSTASPTSPPKTKALCAIAFPRQVWDAGWVPATIESVKDAKAETVRSLLAQLDGSGGTPGQRATHRPNRSP